MPALMVFLAIAAIVIAMVLVVRFRRKNQERLVGELLAELSRRTERAKFADEPCVHETPIRCVRIEDRHLLMRYSWPTGEFIFGRPEVISGVLGGVIDLGQREFSHIEFEVAFERAAEFPHEESMAYRIALRQKGGSLEQMEGVINDRTLATSDHLRHFSAIAFATHIGT